MSEELVKGTESSTIDELLKIGVIGVGNCGGLMTDMAADAGFDGIVINASQKDLSLLKNDKLTLIPIGDGRGTGKSREEAKQFLIHRINLVQDEAVMKFVDEHDVIVIATSIGGGFGSGSSLILADILNKITEGSKVIIVSGVMPFNSELYTAQNHAVAWLKELNALECGYMIYDNTRFEKLPKLDAHLAVNKQFVNDLKALRGDFIHDTITGGIDNRDMLTAISVPGRIVVDTIPLLEEADVIEGSIPATIMQHIKETSAHAELADDKVIRASALMYSLRDEFRNYKPALKQQMQDVFGSHVSDYDNFTDLVDTSDIPDTVTVILSGLSEPTLRINRMISRRDKLEAEILGKNESQSKLGSAGTGDAKLSMKSKSFGSSMEPKSGKSVSDLLAEYTNAYKASQN